MPDDANDFSVYFYFKWDPNYLYVGIEFHDDKRIGLLKDYTAMRFNTLNAYPEIFSFYATADCSASAVASTARTSGRAWNLDNVLKNCSLTSYGFSMEVGLAWQDFNGYIPAANDVHGIVLTGMDYDGDTGNFDHYMYDIGKGEDTRGDINTWNTLTLVAEPGCGDWGYYPEDIVSDCEINLKDFAKLAQSWIVCTDPTNQDCVNLRW